MNKRHSRIRSKPGLDRQTADLIHAEIHDPVTAFATSLDAMTPFSNRSAAQYLEDGPGELHDGD